MSALVLIAAAPATAHYFAEPMAKPRAAKLIIRDTIWQCRESGCVGSKSNSRPAIVCAALVKEVGALRRFSAGGREMPADSLQKCNTHAR